MKIICEHGYYKFYPETPNDLIIFSDTYGVDLVKVGDFYTYPELATLPDYSIKNQGLGGFPAILNYAGKPWDVFRENKLNYDAENGKITKNNPAGQVGENPTNYVWVVVGIPPAFSELSDKTIISGFEGWVNVVKNYTVVARWQNADV